ncbi:hypothetical protein ACIO93_36370 [Streptomyces sp. NPDC087903]|uniref:hypothetical protein n=1 Tax=Streptomyces sp. NPDC087903 TaxID=3365819 RepID=UPI00380BE18D
MTTSSFGRSRRVTAATSALTMIAVVTGAVILTLGAGLPETWWPHTGQAFAADTHPAGDDPCGLIVGPAKTYCEHGTTTTASAEHHDATGAALRLVPAGAGLAVLALWRLRYPAAQRRR